MVKCPTKIDIYWGFQENDKLSNSVQSKYLGLSNLPNDF